MKNIRFDDIGKCIYESIISQSFFSDSSWRAPIQSVPRGVSLQGENGQQLCLDLTGCFCAGRSGPLARPGNGPAWKSKTYSVVLTLNMLNCFEDYKIGIHILICIFGLTQVDDINSGTTMYSQYHACWCAGDFRSQCISRHGIGPISRNISSLASEELTYMNVFVLECLGTLIPGALLGIICNSFFFMSSIVRKWDKK